MEPKSVRMVDTIKMKDNYKNFDILRDLQEMMNSKLQFKEYIDDELRGGEW